YRLLPPFGNIPSRARFDSTLAAIQSARSRAVSSNRRRRLAGDARSQAGDQASVQRACLARSPFGSLTIALPRSRTRAATNCRTPHDKIKAYISYAVFCLKKKKKKPQ